MSLTTGPEFMAKQLEIPSEAAPKLSRIGVLRQIGRAGAETGAIESAARTLSMTIVFADVRVPTDIEGAFAAMIRSRTGAFLILGGPMTWLSRQQIADLAVLAAGRVISRSLDDSAHRSLVEEFLAGTEAHP